MAGFQGVSQTTKDVTTLGRGASDTTAVALAAALKAGYCEIYSDVDGVFTADPRIVPGASRIPQISYEENAGDGRQRRQDPALAMRRVRRARRRPGACPVVLLGQAGYLGQEQRRGADREDPIITGIAHDRSEAKITVIGVPDRLGAAGQIFTTVAEAGINIDMIVQNVSVAEGTTAITFTLPQSDGDAAMVALRAKPTIGFSDLITTTRSRRVGDRRRDVRTRASRRPRSGRWPRRGSTSK